MKYQAKRVFVVVVAADRYLMFFIKRYVFNAYVANAY